MAEGFYDVLGHYKDYPPEWSALKEWEKRGRVDMVLLAKDSLQSEFMQEHCMDALIRMANPDAFEEMHQLAQRREKKAIKALGRMGADAEDAVETLLEYVDADSDPVLQKVTFRALGEIGSADATQGLADKLEMDNDNVRPYAARALGLIGDTRSIDPLADRLAEDESDTVRAAAAWALRQIGTAEALEAAAEYTDERSHLVQHEAERAAEALDADTDPEAPTA
jgi:HEAT repeat protein